jgi:hypothetical protein
MTVLLELGAKNAGYDFEGVWHRCERRRELTVSSFASLALAAL